MVLPMWRSMASVNLMLPKEERKAMLLRLFNDESELVDHSQPLRGPRPPGSTNGTARRNSSSPERSAPVVQTSMAYVAGPVSRFHMMARVSIRDLSLWIPPGTPHSPFHVLQNSCRTSSPPCISACAHTSLAAGSIVAELCTSRMHSDLLVLTRKAQLESASLCNSEEDDGPQRHRPASVHAPRADFRGEGAVRCDQHYRQTVPGPHHVRMGGHGGTEPTYGR